MFNFEERKLVYRDNVFKQEQSTWEKIFGTIGEVSLEPKEELSTDPKFLKILEKNLEPNLSLKELSVRVVQSALEVEFADKATYDLDYAEMIGVLAEALRNAPEMREQMLAVSNMVLRRKLNLRKKTVH
ncbi:hypothetical protein ACFL5G_02060 [Candidatus Margulisiibacteriota bacterium]